MEVDPASGVQGKERPSAPKAKRTKSDLQGGAEVRKVPVPSHRYTPLKDNWMKIFDPVVKNMNLQIRFNLKSRQVEIRATDQTEDVSSLQKATDFVRAFVMGFDVDDALALLRLDDLFLDSFEIQVKSDLFVLS